MNKKITTTIGNRQYFKTGELHDLIQCIQSYPYSEECLIHYLYNTPKFTYNIRNLLHDYKIYKQKDFPVEDKEFLGNIIEKFCYLYVNGLKFEFDVYKQKIEQYETNHKGIELPEFFITYKEEYDLKRQLIFCIITHTKDHFECSDYLINEINARFLNYNYVYKCLSNYINRCNLLSIKDFLCTLLTEIELKNKYGNDYDIKQKLVYQYIDEFLVSDCLSLDAYLSKLHLSEKDKEIYKDLIKQVRESNKDIDTKMEEKYNKNRNKQFYLLKQEHEFLLEYISSVVDNSTILDSLLNIHFSVESLISFEQKNNLFGKEKILNFLSDIDKRLNKSSPICTTGTYIIKGYTLTDEDKENILNFINTHHLPKKQLIFREVARKFVNEEVSL